MTIRFHSQLWNNSIAYNTINSDKRMYSINTQNKSNNKIHSHSLPLMIVWLMYQFYETIQYNPVHSLDYIHLIVTNLQNHQE